MRGWLWIEAWLIPYIPYNIRATYDSITMEHYVNGQIQTGQPVAAQGSKQ